MHVSQNLYMVELLLAAILALLLGLVVYFTGAAPVLI